MWRLLGPVTLASLFLLPTLAHADEQLIRVTTLIDAVAGDGQCSLREALLAAHAGAPHDACQLEGTGKPVVRLSEGVHVLTQGELPITQPMTVRGAGAGRTTIDARSLSRIFHITDDYPTEPTVLEHLKLTGGHAGSDLDGGGALLATGRLVVSDAIVANSTAIRGGGIRAITRDVLLRRTLVIDNTASEAGGGVEFDGDFNRGRIESSTLTGNTAPVASALASRSSTTLRQVTISQNTATDASEGYAVTNTSTNGLFLDAVLMIGNVGVSPLLCKGTRILNSAFLDNHQPPQGTCSPAEVNYVEATEAPSWVRPEDIVVAPGEGPPAFRPLGDYGGPMPVHAPTRDSPVIGRSTCGAPTAYGLDQRGAPRPATGCTLGPVEHGALGFATRIAVATAEQCPHGGFIAFTGEDNGYGGVAQDGLLSAGEVETTEVKCNPPGGLLAVSDEPPGDPCEAGGQRIDTGLDLNANGTLDADEIEKTRYVCHAPPLPETLFEMVGFATSDECPSGGQRLLTGVDANRNGVLDEDEIASRVETCHGASGQDGADGEDGEDGPRGEDGLDGQNGLDGKDGLDGEDGRDGKDAEGGCAAAGAGSLALLALALRRRK